MDKQQIIKGIEREYSALWVVLIFIAFSPEARSQSYIPFPDSNAVWQVDWGFGGGGSGTHQYSTNGDTVIGSYTYNKLEVIGAAGPLFDYFQYANEYVGAYRNALLEQRVYFVPKDSISESILYDFTLVPGDTIVGFLDRSLDLAMSSPETVVINSIDSILIGSTYRKRLGFSHLTLNSGWSGYFIEGVGGDLGLLECLHAHLESNGSLLCFSSNDEAVYPVPSTSPCAPLSQEQLEQTDYSVYPNPAQSYVRIEAPKSCVQYSISNAEGSTVMAHPIPETNRIDISALVPGLYYLQLKDLNGRTVYSHKLLVKQ